jgi:hypothetical protein
VIQRTTRCGHPPIVTFAVAGDFPVFSRALLKLRGAMVAEVRRGINGIVCQHGRVVLRGRAHTAAPMRLRVHAGAGWRNDRSAPGRALA